MKRFYFLLIFIGASTSFIAQTVNVFDWAGGNVITTPRFITFDDSNTELPPTVTIQTYKEYEVFSPNKKYSYTIRLHGTDESMDESGYYDAFSILNSDGKPILFRWGRDMLYYVQYLTIDTSNENYFIQVPLDDESFALIFGGWLYQIDDDAVEMVIVVVNKNKATVVFDGNAFAYKYTAPPNFSMEFTDRVYGLLKDFETFTITDAALKPYTKHKIWRDGNVLKYKTWK